MTNWVKFPGLKLMFITLMFQVAPCLFLEAMVHMGRRGRSFRVTWKACSIAKQHD